VRDDSAAKVNRLSVTPFALAMVVNAGLHERCSVIFIFFL
jgi:hypothetical protein